MIYTVKANTDPFVSAIKSAQKSIEEAEKRLESSKKSAEDYRAKLAKAQSEQVDSSTKLQTGLTKIKSIQDNIAQATQNTKKIITETKDQIIQLNKQKAEGVSLTKEGEAMGKEEQASLSKQIALKKVFIAEEKARLDKKKQSLQEELTSAQKILKVDQDRVKEQTKIAQNLNNALNLQLKTQQAITSEIKKSEQAVKQTENTILASQVAPAFKRLSLIEQTIKAEKDLQRIQQESSNKVAQAQREAEQRAIQAHKRRIQENQEIERARVSRAANASSNAIVSSARSYDYRDEYLANTSRAIASTPTVSRPMQSPTIDNSEAARVEALRNAYLNAAQAQTQFSATTERSSQTLKNLVNPMETVNRSLAGMVATYVSFSFVRDTVQDVLDISMKFDSLDKVFEAVTGSMSGAERAMSLVRSESDRLGLPVLEAAKGLKGLQAAGMAAGIPLSDLEEQFKAASQATAFFAMSTTESERVFKAWTQILSKDKLMAEELTGQLGESLPGAIAIMARALGYVNKNGLPDTARLMKEMAKGTIDGSDAMEKFAKELLKMTDKGILTASQAAMREMNRMQNAIKEFQVSLGEAGLLDAATAFFKSTADFLSGIKTEDLKEFGAVITDTIVPALGMYAVYMLATSKAGQALIAGLAPIVTTQSVLARETIAATAAERQRTVAVNQFAAAQTAAIGVSELSLLQLRASTVATTGLTAATRVQTAASIASTVTTQRQTIQQTALSAAMITTNAGATEFSRKQYAMSVAASATTKAVGALTSTLKFALPFLLLGGVMIAWEGLEKSVISVDRQIENMLDDKNWDGVIAKAQELRAALDGRENGGILTRIKNNIKDFAEYASNNTAALIPGNFYTAGAYDKFQEDKTKRIKEEAQAAQNASKISLANLAATVDESGSNAAAAAKKYAKYIEQAGIMTKAQLKGIKGEIQDLGSVDFYDNLTQEQKNYYKEYRVILDKNAKYQAMLQAQKNADKKKDGKAGKEPKDTTADEISAIKKKIELQAKEIENELVMANMRSEFGKDELEYYKELNSTAQKQNEIEAELIILMSKKPKKGEEAAQQVKINGLVDEYIGSAKLIEQINAKNVITTKDAVKSIEEMEIAGYKVYEYGKEKNDIEKEYKKLLEQNATIESQTAAKKHKDNRLTFLALKTEYEANKSKLDLAKDITDVAVEGNQKQRTLEELRHKDAINNLEYEMATASEQDTARLEQLRIRIALENEIYKQNTSSLLKYINSGFDALEKGIDDTLFDVLTGKFENFGESIVDMFEDFGTQIGRELTSSIASEMTGFLKGGVKDLLGLGTDSSLTGFLGNVMSDGSKSISMEAIGQLISDGAMETGDNQITTAGGTIINTLTGAIIGQGTDIASLTKATSSMTSMYGNVATMLKGGWSAYYGGGVSSIGGYVGQAGRYLGSSTLGEFGYGMQAGSAGVEGLGGAYTAGGAAGDFMGGMSFNASSQSAASTLGGAVGGAGYGYALGSAGDYLTRSKTQAPVTGAIGGAYLGATYAALGSIPVYGWIAAAALLLAGGAMGSNQQVGAGVKIKEASAAAVNGETYIETEYKNWFHSSRKETDTPMTPEMQKGIQGIIDAYDYMAEQLGEIEKITMSGFFQHGTVQEFADVDVAKAFLTNIMNLGDMSKEVLTAADDSWFGSVDGLKEFWGDSLKEVDGSLYIATMEATEDKARLDAVYQTWKDYAKSIDKGVTDAISEQIGIFSQNKRSYTEWLLGFEDKGIDLLKYKAKNAADDLARLTEVMGISGVTASNFADEMGDAVKENFTPETIANWQALGQTMQISEEATKTYKQAIADINLSLDTIVMKSKGYDLAMLNNIDTIEDLTGITMNSISDIERVGNSLKGIPNITSDAINAFGSLADSIIAMKNKVTSSVQSSIASVMPETVDVRSEYVKFFGTLPTTLDEWRKQGEALITKIEGVNVPTQPLMSESDTLALLQSLTSKTDKEVADILIPQVKSGRISMSIADKVLGYTPGQVENFLKEHGGYTPEKPINITDEQLNIYNAFGQILKDMATAGKDTTTAGKDTTTAVEDLADKLNYTSDSIRTYKEWLVEGDDIKTLELSKQAFDDLQKQIGISGVKVETFLGQFGDALKGGLTDDTLNLWEDMGDALMDFVDGLKDLRDTWQDMATSFGSAADDIRGKTTKSFAEIRAMAPTPDNYQDLITMLNDSRQKEIDNLNEASKLRIDALEKEKDLFLDLSQIIKSINARIIDIAPVNNVYYRTELASVKGSISRGETVDTSGLSSSVSTYLDKFRTSSATKEDYIRESARVREEIAGVQGYNTTLTDIEKAIKNEEWALKAAIDNVNRSAIAILDGWREFSLENTNRIVEAILSLKVPELATYQPSTQPIGAAGTTPRPTTTNEFTSMTSSGDVRTTRDIVEAGLTAAIGSTPSDAIIDAWTAKAEATSLSAIGIPDNIINGSYATGIDRVPTDRISKIHKDEAVLNRGDAEEWRDSKASGNPYGGTNAELVGVMIEMKNVMQEMAAELIRTKEEIKEVRAILRKVNQKGDGFNVYQKVG